jgi:hypothetical protein
LVFVYLPFSQGSIMNDILAPEIQNVTLAASGTAYPASLKGAKHFEIQSRTAADFTVGLAATQATPEDPLVMSGEVFTVKSGSVLRSPEKLALQGEGTVYFASENNGQVIEVLVWR